MWSSTWSSIIRISSSASTGRWWWYTTSCGRSIAAFCLRTRRHRPISLEENAFKDVQVQAEHEREAKFPRYLTETRNSALEREQPGHVDCTSHEAVNVNKAVHSNDWLKTYPEWHMATIANSKYNTFVAAKTTACPLYKVYIGTEHICWAFQPSGTGELDGINIDLFTGWRWKWKSKRGVGKPKLISTWRQDVTFMISTIKCLINMQLGISLEKIGGTDPSFLTLIYSFHLQPTFSGFYESRKHINAMNVLPP